MNLKKVLQQVHLWIGLATGLLFFIIAFSGALYTWEPEMSRWLYKQAVSPEYRPVVSVSQLKETLSQEFPEGDFRTAMFSNKKTAYKVLLYAPGTYYHAYLNPYSGKLIHLQDMKKGVINKLKGLHRNLLLGQIGREIVHWVTLLALPMLITGVYLWATARVTRTKQRFRIKWDASPKRLNYDLHNVLGFYATWIVVFMILTGIFWGFEPVKSSLKILLAEGSAVYEQPKSDVSATDSTIDTFIFIDSLMKVYRVCFPNKQVRVSNPHPEDAPIQVSIIDPRRLVHKVDQYYFDRYTGKVIEGNFQHARYKDASAYTTLNGMVYDIHMGNILGLPGRILAFLASFVAASLPITGFLYWWGRKKRK